MYARFKIPDEVLHGIADRDPKLGMLIKRYGDLEIYLWEMMKRNEV